MKTGRQECDRMLAVKEKSQAIGEFLEWLEQKGVRLMEEVELEEEIEVGPLSRPLRKTIKRPHMIPMRCSLERALAEFFAIDLDKVEQEKRAMLAELWRR